MRTISNRLAAVAVAATVVVAGIASTVPAEASTGVAADTSAATTDTAAGAALAGTGATPGAPSSDAPTATATVTLTAPATPTAPAADPSEPAAVTPSAPAATPSTPAASPSASTPAAPSAPATSGKTTGTAAALGNAVAAAAAAASANGANGTYVSTIKAGTTLYPGHQLTSGNGQFRLIMQGDGNLVEYGIGNRVLWASNTANAPGAVAVFRVSGQLVVQKGKKVLLRRGTVKTARDYTMRADGDLAMRNAKKTVVWRTKTFQDRIYAGDVLLPGTKLRSAGSGQWLEVHANGNMEQFNRSRAVWGSVTSGHPGTYAALQADGNFVLYAPGRKAVWSSRTSGTGSGQLLVQVDGNVVVYGGSGTRTWSTFPVTKGLWPVVSHTITGRFGDDRGPNHTPRYHQGVDAAVGVGTPVYASGSGVVTTATYSPTFGNYVIVSYGLTTVLTAHLSAIEVRQGQTVSVGTEIAKSGNTGQSEGPHVHVETRVNGVLKDPLTILTWR